MRFFLVPVVNIFLVALFLYAKLLPHKGKLNGQYQQLFGFFDAVFGPILVFLRKVARPVQIGQGISLDMAQIILLLVLLLLLNSV